MATAASIGQVLDASVDAAPARPLLTFYDHAAGERVELSALTTRNWVDKTANLLTDVVGVEVGTAVSVELPLHWQTVVWLLACWRVGAVVVPPGDGDVTVVGPDSVAAGAVPVGEVVATALHALGAPFPRGVLPPGVTDFGAEVLAQGDVFLGSGVPATAPGWRDGRALDHGELVDEAAAIAARLRWVAGGRLLSDVSPTTLEGALLTAVAPLVASGSVVLLRHPDPQQLAELARTERVDVTVLGDASSEGAPVPA